MNSITNDVLSGVEFKVNARIGGFCKRAIITFSVSHTFQRLFFLGNIMPFIFIEIVIISYTWNMRSKISFTKKGYMIIKDQLEPLQLKFEEKDIVSNKLSNHQNLCKIHRYYLK